MILTKSDLIFFNIPRCYFSRDARKKDEYEEEES